MNTSGSNHYIHSNTAESDLEHSGYGQPTESSELSFQLPESMGSDTDDLDLVFDTSGLFDDDNADMPVPGVQRQKPVTTPESLGKDYRFIEEIGHGAQGKIYRAKRLKDDKDVVVKQLNISSIKSWKEYDLFHREAEILQSINMDGVARFYDAVECLDDDPPCSYIVQEYISGFSLQQMIQSGHRFLVTDVYDILIQILYILHRLHHHDPPVIHRDIKPSNIMISTDRAGHFGVTIIDFGAVANPQVQGGGSTVAGTIGYMPPEQLMGKPVPASDIYSLAAMAVQLFCGKSPAAIPTRDFRLIFEPEMQDKPHELVTTLRQMLEPKVEQRLADIPDIIEKFKNYKENRFKIENIQNRKDSAYDAAYENKLKSVRYIGENGNIDLWQQLPELNRSFPDAYARSRPAQPVEKKKRDWSDLGYVLFYGWVVVSTILGGGLLISGDEAILFLMIAWLFLLILGLILDQVIRKIIALRRNAAVDTDSLINDQTNYQQIVDLFGSSRKGMATIVNVQYVSVRQYQVVMLNTFRTGMMNCYATVHGAPVFKVDYKFNPPDDIRTSDIIHYFYTYTEPENHYNIGDPLPILYKITDHFFEDIVSSMPFPVPVDDIYDNRLVDASSSLCLISDASAGYIRDFYPRFKKDPGDALTKLLADFPKIQYDAYEILSQIIEARLNDENIDGWCGSLCVRALSMIGVEIIKSGYDQIPDCLWAVIEYYKRTIVIPALGYNQFMRLLLNVSAIFDIQDDPFWTDMVSIFNRLPTPDKQRLMFSTLNLFPAHITQRFLNRISDYELIRILDGPNFDLKIYHLILCNRLRRKSHPYCAIKLLRIGLRIADYKYLEYAIAWLKKYEPECYDNDDCMSFVKDASLLSLDVNSSLSRDSIMCDAFHEFMMQIINKYKLYFAIDKPIEFKYIKYLPDDLIRHLLYMAYVKFQEENKNCLRNVLTGLYFIDNPHKNMHIVHILEGFVVRVQDSACVSLCVANLASMIIANKVNYEHLPKSICDYDALIVRCVEAIIGCLASEQVAIECITQVFNLMQFINACYSYRLAGLSQGLSVSYDSLVYSCSQPLDFFVELYGRMLSVQAFVDYMKRTDKLLYDDAPVLILAGVMTRRYVKCIDNTLISSYMASLMRIEPSGHNVLLMIDIIKALSGIHTSRTRFHSYVLNIINFYKNAQKTKKCADELAMLKHEVRCFGDKAELSRRTRNLLSELFNGR